MHANYSKLPFPKEPTSGIPKLQHRHVMNGMLLAALPPGEVAVSYFTRPHIVCVKPVQTFHEIAVGTDKLKREVLPASCIGWVPPETDFRVRLRNPDWMVLMELHPERAPHLEAEMLDGRDLPRQFLNFAQDPAVGPLSFLLSDHLRHQEVDPLYVQSIGLAIISRGIYWAGIGHDRVSIRGVDRRVERSVEYIEAHLGEPLDVETLSAIASLSPGHYARAFRSVMSEPVWKYVRRRRCERARDLLVHTKEPIVEIALRCGFSSQGHLTSSFKSHFGVTPGAMRSHRF